MINVNVAWVLALAIHTLALGSIAGCSGDSQKYNPYVGSVINLPPKEVGQFKLAKTEQITKPGYKVMDSYDAVEAVYKSDDQRVVTMQIFNYSSVEAAIAALEVIRMRGGGDSDRFGGEIDGEDWPTEDKKSKEGIVGKRLAAGDDVFWTNGSLFFAVDIEPRDADPTIFEKDLAF